MTTALLHSQLQAIHDAGTPLLFALAGLSTPDKMPTKGTSTSLGVDFLGEPDITSFLALCYEKDCLRQDLLHRLTCTPGNLFYDDNYGIDVMDFLGGKLTPTDLFRIAAKITNEVRKDDRVRDARTEVSILQNGFTARLIVALSQGPFILTLTVTPSLVSLTA